MGATISSLSAPTADSTFSTGSTASTSRVSMTSSLSLPELSKPSSTVTSSISTSQKSWQEKRLFFQLNFPFNLLGVSVAMNQFSMEMFYSFIRNTFIYQTHQRRENNERQNLLSLYTEYM